MAIGQGLTSPLAGIVGGRCSDRQGEARGDDFVAAGDSWMENQGSIHLRPPMPAAQIKLALAVVAIVVLFMPSTAVATWPVDGVSVGGASALAQDAVSVPDGSGGWYVAWVDFRAAGPSSISNIYLQRVAPTGDLAPGWPSDGLAVSASAAAERAVRLVRDGFGGVLLCWTDLRNGNGDVYVQRVLASGQIAPNWPASGCRATDAPNGQGQSQIAADGTGGAFVVWQDDRTIDIDHRSQVYGQHVSAQGLIAPGWPVDGLPISTFHTGAFRLVISDGAGGCFAAWSDLRRGGALPDGFDVYAQHLLPDGSIAAGWVPNGNLVAPKRGARQLTPDGTGGFYVSCVTLSLNPVLHEDQYTLVRYSAAGVPATGWSATGVALSAANGFRNEVACVADSAGGVIASWDDAGPYTGDIYAVRIRPDGSVASGWTQFGMPVSDPYLDDESASDVTPDGMGGAFFSWERYDGTTRGFIQHISSHGTIASGWPGGGLSIASTQPQNHPKVAHDGQASALCFWQEGGSPTTRLGIFAQRFLADGIVAAQISLASSDASAERVALVWQGAAIGDPSAHVERRSSLDVWRSLGPVQHDGVDRVRFEDRDVEPGARYAYRLVWSEGGTPQATSESWIDVPVRAVLALEGLRPNPAIGPLRVDFSLAGNAPASLELLDLAGRRVLAREVGSEGEGHHVLTLSEGQSVAPGMYWLRLRQSGRQLLARAVVMR